MKPPADHVGDGGGRGVRAKTPLKDGKIISHMNI